MKKFKNPKDLLQWMGKNIEYGWRSKDRNKKQTKWDGYWWNNYLLLTPQEVYKYKIGTCYDQSIFEYFIFKKQWYELYDLKLIYIQHYKNNNHLFLMFKKKEDTKWSIFENSFYKYRGIHTGFLNKKEAAKFIYTNMVKESKNDTGYEFREIDPNKIVGKRLTAKQCYDVFNYNWNKNKQIKSKLKVIRKKFSTILEKYGLNAEDLKDHHAISIALFNKNNEILIMDHVKFNVWTIPMGKVKPGETVEEALLTEMKEELDITPINYKEVKSFTRTYPRQGKKIKVIQHIFVCKKWKGTIKNKEPIKHRSIKFVSIFDLKKSQYNRGSDATKEFLKWYEAKGKFLI